MVLLAHMVLFRPSGRQKTFSLQYLLAVPVAPVLQARFSAASTVLFDAFGASSTLGDGEFSIWEQCASKASLGLAQLAQVFNEIDQVRIFI